MMSTNKFAFFSLGCKVNQAEIENITRYLSQYGLKKALSDEKADICIINTCTVTNMADQKSRQKIRRVIKDNPGSFIIVTGCSAEAHRDEIKQINGVNLVIGNKEKESLGEIIKSKLLPSSNIEKKSSAEFIQEGRTRAFLKIQDGCKNYCSYCIIPFVRGKPHSIPAEEVIDKVKNLCKADYGEIVITGINLGNYGKDLIPETNLCELLKKILACEVKRLRISSIEPVDIDINLLKLIKENSSFCHHLHIPLQYGHNVILKSMNRHYTVEEYKRIVNLAKEQIEDISITTDVIVGFPGEKEEYFLETIKTIEELEFAKLHVFSYSPRENTKAFNFSEIVDEKTKKERSRILIDAGEKLTEKYYKKFINKILPVLIEHKKDKKTGLLKGLTGNYIPVFIEGEEKYLGHIIPIKIINVENGKVNGIIYEK